MTGSEEKHGGMSPEEYAKMHQGSFRTAFDFLKQHFPPGDTPEWWEQTAKDASAASESQLDNPLAKKLLIGVYDYLEYEFKERRN